MEIIDKLSLADYLWIRKLRNANCHHMTGNSRPISFFRQFLFFLVHDRAAMPLYLIRHKDQRAGYLLLREFAPGCAYITECLHIGSKGIGLGRRAIDFAKSRHSTLVAEILPSNLPSIRLHTRNGFVLQSEGPVLRYVWSRNTA